MGIFDLLKRKRKIVILVAGGAALYMIAALILHQIPRKADERAKDRELAALLARATSSAPTLFPIARVVDGDTFIVSVNGGMATIRLIGMNTPETVDPRKPVECFGPEASARAHALLDGATIGLARDPTIEGLDIYDRVLAYAYMPDGTPYNQGMIADGYAYEYTYKTKYQHQKDFRAAQSAAKKSKLGLWSPSTCNGKKKK